MSYTELLVAGFTFNKSRLGEAARDKSNTIPSLVLIGLSILASTVVALLKGRASGSTGFGRYELNSWELILVEILSGLIGTLLLAYFLYLVFKLFHVSTVPSEIFPVIGAMAAWNLLGTLLAYLLDVLGVATSFLMLLGAIVWFITMIVLLLGLMGYTGEKWYLCFLVIVLTYILIFVVTFLLGAILEAVLDLQPLS